MNSSIETVERMKRYIAEHLQDQITASDVAKVMTTGYAGGFVTLKH